MKPKQGPAVNDESFNPLDKENLGEAVAKALLSRAVHPMPPENKFQGAGVYALYYVGDFEPYRRLALRNREDPFSRPIYVGKAQPVGSRKGGEPKGPADLPSARRGSKLYSRLKKHAASITYAENLDITDFLCRYLVVDEVRFPLGEALLIERTRPLWNLVVEGFGNHDPGKGRHAGMMPVWDVLPPGRPWAKNLQAHEKELPEILRAIDEHLRGDA
ncbi:MAG: Eco29kI family restriction endonuclease [Myxococcales bacterium]|nr:Eco29kI family restriction endonuclease [Myxococcales bacterium]